MMGEKVVVTIITLFTVALLRGEGCERMMESSGLVPGECEDDDDTIRVPEEEAQKSRNTIRQHSRIPQ
jgi:hypothetical protein